MGAGGGVRGVGATRSTKETADFSKIEDSVSTLFFVSKKLY